MKRYLLLFVIALFFIGSYGQDIADLPIPIGAGTAEVWNNSIYHFGGSNNWAGSIVYPRIYRFDGMTWSHHDSIPDNNMWDVESVLSGNEVFLLSGWLSGPQLLRKYDLLTGNWTSLANSPNTTWTWGVTAEHINGKIYLFLPDGNVHEYTISSNTWETKTAVEKTGTRDLSSILYNNEIYVIGYNDSTFFRYSPLSDQWMQLSNSLYQVGACAMGVINELIYCIGGNLNGSSSANYRSVIVYNISTNTWALDSLKISGKRHWMATAEYKGGLYIIGGIDSAARAVNTVEEIVPQGTAVGMKEAGGETFDSHILMQNYPNPFNPVTVISWELAVNSFVELSIYNLLGEKVAALVSEYQRAGNHTIEWDAAGFVSGIYLCKLTTNDGRQGVRKLVLLK